MNNQQMYILMKYICKNMNTVLIISTLFMILTDSLLSFVTMSKTSFR